MKNLLTKWIFIAQFHLQDPNLDPNTDPACRFESVSARIQIRSTVFFFIKTKFYKVLSSF